MRSPHVIAAFLLALAVPAPFAGTLEHPLLSYGSNEELIFVLSERTRPPAGLEAPNDTALTVHHLVVDEYFAIIEQFNVHFDQYEQLSPDDVPSAWETIQAEFAQLTTEYQASLSAAYRSMIVAGEIASRYGVEDLPAVIQLRGRDHFKLVDDAHDFDQALRQMNGRAYDTRTP